MKPKYEPEVITAAFLLGMEAGQARLSSPTRNPFGGHQPELRRAWLDGLAVGKRIEQKPSVACAQAQL